MKLTRFGFLRMLMAGALLFYFFSYWRLGDGVGAILKGNGLNAMLARTLPLAGLLFSGLLMLGSFSRLSAAVSLLCLNLSLLLLPVIAELHYPFLSLMLGTYAIFANAGWLDWRPSGPHEELRDSEIWHLPLLLSICFGFTVMGIYKMFFPLWWDGQAVALLCPRGPLGSAIPALCQWLPSRWLGYLVVFIEASSLPLAVFPRTRPLAWLLNVILHLSVSQFFYVRRISFVTLLMLAFLFDRRWVQQPVRPRSKAIEF